VFVLIQVCTWEGGEVIQKKVLIRGGQSLTEPDRWIEDKWVIKKVLVGGGPVYTKDTPPIPLEDFTCPPIKVLQPAACLLACLAAA
jgi:hypothetical protein